MRQRGIFVAAIWLLGSCGSRERPRASPAELAGSGKVAEAASAVAAAPIDARPALAEAVASACPRDRIDALANAAGGDADLLTAVGDRIERERGSAGALAVRERAATAAPDRAESWDAVGRARAAAGRMDAALEAWDRAAAAAPAQPTYRLAPIRALVATGDPVRARSRAGELARAARAAGDVDALVTASAAAAAAGDSGEAIGLARAAQTARPGDGRLAFLVGDRLAGGGDAPGAARAWLQLLVCGAHGRPWHRHEVAGRLLRLAEAGQAAAVESALHAPPTCSPVDEADLASYLAELEKLLKAGAGGAGSAPPAE